MERCLPELLACRPSMSPGALVRSAHPMRVFPKENGSYQEEHRLHPNDAVSEVILNIWGFEHFPGSSHLFLQAKTLTTAFIHMFQPKIILTPRLSDALGRRLGVGPLPGSKPP